MEPFGASPDQKLFMSPPKSAFAVLVLFPFLLHHMLVTVNYSSQTSSTFPSLVPFYTWLPWFGMPFSVTAEILFKFSSEVIIYVKPSSSNPVQNKCILPAIFQHFLGFVFGLSIRAQLTIICVCDSLSPHPLAPKDTFFFLQSKTTFNWYLHRPSTMSSYSWHEKEMNWTE